MPSGSRVRGNNVYGLTSSPLTIGSTTLDSPGLTVLPVVASGHSVIVLDPKRMFGEPEIVLVTTHVSQTATASILRAQYGTAARSHPINTPWAHIPIIDDFIRILTSTTRPSDPYEGQMIYETDTDLYKSWNGTAWVSIGSGGGATIYQNTSAPATPVEGDLWIDTDESAGTGLSSILAYAEGPSSDQIIASPLVQTDLTNLTVTVTVPAGRRLRISGKSFPFSNGTTEQVDTYIVQDGIIISWDRVTLATNLAETQTPSVVVSPTAGTHTYKLAMVKASAGAASLTNAGGAQYRSYILVEDITGTLWPAGQSIGVAAFASEPWTSYTPTFSNITVGNGTNVGRYQKIGRTVHCMGRFTLGSTSAVTSFMYMNLPVPAKDFGTGLIYAQDAGLTHWMGTWSVTTLDGPITSGSGTASQHWQPTLPFTWGTGDWFQWQITYEAAS